MELKRVVIDENIVVFSLHGSLDGRSWVSSNGPDLIRNCEMNAVFDLTDVDFLDSAGLSVLVQLIRDFRDKGLALALVCHSEAILKVLKITSIDKIVLISSTRQEAVKALQLPGI